MSVPPPTGIEPTSAPAAGVLAAASPSDDTLTLNSPGSGVATGPAPTREAALSILLREGEATAAGLAHRLGVSVQVMRRHLRSLEEDGLVEAFSSHDGPGRPSNRWHLTPRGHERFPDGSEHFALGLLHSISSSLPPETLRALLHDQARSKATVYHQRIGEGSLRERLERLVDLRRQEGYVAELRADTELPSSAGEHQGGWILSEFHCSVMRIAEAFPMVCDQELQLIRHTFPDCQVERVHWRLQDDHFCGFRLTPGDIKA